MIKGTYKKPTKPGWYCLHSPSLTHQDWGCVALNLVNGILQDYAGRTIDRFRDDIFWVGPLPDPPEVKRDRD